MPRGRTATIVAGFGLALVLLAIPLVVDPRSNEGMFQALVFVFVVAVASAVLTAWLTASPPATRWDWAARLLMLVLGLVAVLAVLVFFSFHCYERPAACAPQETLGPP